MVSPRLGSLLYNTLVTITTSAGPKSSENDTKYTHHNTPLSCIHCGWAEVLIHQPTGNISWLMRLQNGRGRNNGQSTGIEVVAGIDANIDESIDSSDTRSAVSH